MTVKQARELLSDKPDDLTDEEFDSMIIIMPLSGVIDEVIVSPCIGESGVTEIEVEGDVTDCFVFASHGFFEEKDEDDFVPELN